MPLEEGMTLRAWATLDEPVASASLSRGEEAVRVFEGLGISDPMEPFLGPSTR